MWALQASRDSGGGLIARIERDRPDPGLSEVRVRTLAIGLNYRDVALLRGASFNNAAGPYTPFSDACGVVDAIGPGVERWALGDRVCSSFFPNWLAGPAQPETQVALGASELGVGQEYFVVAEHALVAAPDHLSAVEAATLPCAGVTAWNAVIGSGLARPGATILLQGTGGVSLFALQFALQAGTSVIVTSSSDEKLARVREMGAAATINYRQQSEWAKAAREITDGRGVDLVVEVGGAGTFAQSLRAIRLGGAISVVGMLTGASETIDIRAIYGSNANIRGITVGSRTLFEEMNRAIIGGSLKPVVSEVYSVAQIQEAIVAMAGGGAFGKIVIDCTV